MKIIKRFSAALCAVLMAVCCSCFTAFASDGQEKAPIYPASLLPGTYEITVTSSASMFRIVHCDLTVSGSDMTAEMTLSGKGYEKLFMGTGEQAEQADDSAFIYYHEDAEGKYVYTVPVEALDKEIDCAAFSFKRQRWYDRKLVFTSDSLPESAIVKAESAGEAKDVSLTVWIAAACVLFAVGAFAALIVFVIRKK